MVAKRQPKDTAEVRGRVGGMTGQNVHNVKSIERNEAGEIVRRPGDVDYVRDEVAPAEEAAREAGEV